MEPLIGPQDIEIAELLPVLAKLCGLVAVLGIIFAVRGLVTGIFWIVKKFVQGVTFGLLDSVPGQHAAEQAITSALGSAITGIESSIGYSWHQTARLVDHIGRELYGLAEFSWIAIAALLTLMQPDQWRKLWDFLTHRTGATLDYTKAMHVHHGRTARVTRAQAIPQTVPRLGRLERQIDTVLEPDIQTLRERSRAVTEEMARVWHRVRALDKVIGAGVLTGVVSLALARLGGSWIRCANWRTLGRRVCGIPLGLLDELLASAFLAFAVTDICDFAIGAQAVAQELVPLFTTLVDVENALVGCHGATAPPALTVAAVAVPPALDPLPLAA